ncbi:MAG: hypothetical protein ACO1N1_10500 [Dyadobacter fermentans]
MKRVRASLAMLCIAAGMLLTSCDTTTNKESGGEGSGSASETTPNDSSGAESNKAMGVGEGNQNEELGYPANQSNLNADSTRKKHDNDVGKPDRNE